MVRVLQRLLSVDPERGGHQAPREVNVETLHRETDLARGTVHNAVTRLARVLDSRPHRANATRGRRGGKPTTLYRLSRDAGCALVLDFNHDRVSAWRSDSLGNVHAIGETRLDVDKDPQSAIAAGAVLLRRLPSATWEDVVGIGLSIPAPVDPKRNMTLGHVLPGWEANIDDLEKTLREHLREQIGGRQVPIVADNDANLASLAEYRAQESRRDLDKKISNLVLVKMVPGSIGVGAGAIVNGQQLRGTGFAMELGHLGIDAPLPEGAREFECPHCKRTNCLQARISTHALIGNPAPSWDDVVKWTRDQRMALRGARDSAIQANDRAELERLEASLHDLATDDKTKAIVTAGEEMGRALAKVVTLLDPDVLALEGELARAWLDTSPASLSDVVGDPLKKTFEAHCPLSREEPVFPKLAGPGGNCARGGAIAVLDQHLISFILKRVNS